MSQELHLPLDVYSPDQGSQLLLELHAYSTAVHKATVQVKVTKKSVELPELPDLLSALLTANKVSPTDIAALDALHAQLEAQLKTAPVMHLTLTAIPGRTFKRQITVWFRTQIHPLSLITFSARRDIGGGIVLQAGSHVYDHSFRKQILANPKRIGELAGV